VLAVAYAEEAAVVLADLRLSVSLVDRAPGAAVSRSKKARSRPSAVRSSSVFAPSSCYDARKHGSRR
jgi:hypothetical protein